MWKILIRPVGNKSDDMGCEGSFSGFVAPHLDWAWFY